MIEFERQTLVQAAGAPAGMPLFLPRSHHGRAEDELASAVNHASSLLPFTDRMEQAFGTDLGDVRVQLGGDEAEAGLDGLNVTATTSNRIVFGTHAPSSTFIAHEVVHMIRQWR